MPHSYVSLRDTDLSTLAPSSQNTNPSQGKVAIVSDSDYASLSCYLTGGGAGASGTVDFTFALSPDGTHYDTTAITTVSITMSGTATIQKSAILLLSGARFLKWLSVSNNDASVAATNLNVILGKHWSAQ